MIGFYHGLSLPATENLKSGIYFIVNEGKGKLYRVLADATEPVLVAETTDASLIADVAKAKEDIQKNATSVANALESIAKITAKHGVELENITTEASAIRGIAEGAASQAATNKAAHEKNAKDIATNAGAIAAIKNGTTIDSFKKVEEELAKKQATGDYATKTEAQGYASEAASAVDAKLGFEATTDAATLKAYVDNKTEGIASEGTVSALNERVAGIEADYLKAADKTELEGKINDKAAQTDLEAVSAVANAAVAKSVYDEKVAALVAEDTRIAGLVTAEQSRAEGVEADFEERIAAMETFWDATEDKDDVVNTLKEIQDYIASDETGAATMAGNIQANTQAISAMDTAYKAADKALQERVSTLEGEMDSAEGRLADLEALFGEGDGTVADMIADAVAAEKAEREAGDAAAEASAAAALATAQGAQAAAEAADAKAVAAQGEVDALEGVVATKAAAADLTALTTRVTTAEGEIDTLQSEMDAAEGRLDAVEKKASDNATAIGTNASNIADLMTALEWKQA